MAKEVIEVDFATGGRTSRALTAEEKAEFEATNAALAAEAQARLDAKASAISKLEALGLTLDEVSAAFGLEA